MFHQLGRTDIQRIDLYNISVRDRISVARYRDSIQLLQHYQNHEKGIVTIHITLLIQYEAFRMSYGILFIAENRLIFRTRREWEEWPGSSPKSR